MTALLITAAMFVVGIVVWHKIVKWRWFRDPAHDRRVALLAINEMLSASGVDELDQFSQFPLAKDKALQVIQRKLFALYNDPANFLDSPNIKQCPRLSDQGRERVLEIKSELESHAA